MTRLRRVFVVDGDRSVRQGLNRLLRAAGHDVCALASIDDFLGELDSETSGCLVLDANLGGPSGAELRKQIEQRGARLTIVGITARDDAETREQSVELGAVGLFRKPVDGTALRDIIDWALRAVDGGVQEGERTS